ILTGFTSSDESTGEWNYFVPENTNSPALTYTWDIESDTEFELHVTAIPTEFGVAAMDYIKNGDENTVTINNGDSVTMAYWNESTDSGWVELPGEERQCYTAFLNTACS
ncbi:MAG: hypothetical protein R3220_07440, partial [Balneolaceae bacterium]|nr:hypothetical protein [Balneolaceae bacterium]